MNIVTKSFIQAFLGSQELASTSDSEDFEKYAAYSVMRRVYGQEFNLDDVLVGGGADTGIDALGIMVNGALITSKEEIDDLKHRNKYLDITYIFVQAKISEKFETKEIATFCRGIEDFFLENYGLNRNEEIKQKAELSNYLFNNVIHFEKNPKCVFYYVTTGYWNDDDNDSKKVMEATKEALERSSMFSDIAYKICGSKEINDLYKESCKRLAVQIYFPIKATLPMIPNIESSYIGILPLDQFKRLIVDDDGYIRSVFEDNIRDFQLLSNPVNQKINETLAGPSYQLFPLLNNGVTIVADKIKQSGDNLVLYDYQIVNGCQTSNVIARHSGTEKLEHLLIPVKIIVTNNADIKNSITFATNNQTSVKKEQLAALSDFQRNLEDYYNANINAVGLYYERRSNQYSDSDKPKARIISVPNQIKAFAAMFLRLPHRVTSYYGMLTKNIATKDSEIFNPKHVPLTYYLAGLALYRLETLFRNGTIDSKHKRHRYFILLAFCLSVIKEKLSKAELSEPKANERVLAPIRNILLDSTSTNNRLEAIASKLDDIEFSFEKDYLKAYGATDRIINLYS